MIQVNYWHGFGHDQVITFLFPGLLKDQSLTATLITGTLSCPRV